MRSGPPASSRSSRSYWVHQPPPTTPRRPPATPARLRETASIGIDAAFCPGANAASGFHTGDKKFMPSRLVGVEPHALEGKPPPRQPEMSPLVRLVAAQPADVLPLPRHEPPLLFAHDPNSPPRLRRSERDRSRR